MAAPSSVVTTYYSLLTTLLTTQNTVVPMVGMRRCNLLFRWRRPLGTMCPFTVGGEALDFEYAEAFDFEDDAAEEG